MNTLVIAGGTDGIGKALAELYLGRGDTVVVVGRNAGKGRLFLDAARAAGAAGRAFFVTADLSLLAETSRAADEIRAAFPVVDALVFCARHYRSRRTETAEGYEENFALFYLSRHLLGQALAEPLARAQHPVVVNVAGPGAGLELVQWDDLQLSRHYHGGAALGQGGKLNDLLGVSYAQQYGPAGIRYVLIHPGVTATGFSGEYDAGTLPHIRSMREHAKPVEAALPPIVDAIDKPPAEALSAFVEGRRIPVDTRGFDPAAARRLRELTDLLLAGG
ncbi:SDR family NAD(P)-dependent oxidoreductase [Streptomyces sp. NPDC001743]|uniref:SDR family NAD(P)-dependent oxidoreductase n=1 Tax=Streptomyces sp. NPDC001743 TaxID=3154397 RepID=UPI0033183078